MQNQYGDEVEFIGVAGKYEQADVEVFIAKYWVTEFPHVIDSDGAIFERYGVTGHPTIIFIDADGNIEAVPGSIGPQVLKQRVEALLGLPAT